MLYIVSSIDLIKGLNLSARYMWVNLMGKNKKHVLEVFFNISIASVASSDKTRPTQGRNVIG